MPENPQRPSRNITLREKPILFGLATQKERPNGGIRVSIHWGRIILVLLALSVIGWISATSALYVYLKHVQDFETVHFTDALLLQRSELRRKMGDQQIETSIAHIKDGKYNDAFRLLHFGVARSPGNLEGRKLIAEFYELAMKRPDIAADFLLKGLEYGGSEDIEYVKRLLQLLLRNQMDEEIQQIADEHLPEEPKLTDFNRTLALGATNASYQQGKYDLAEDYLINYNLLESVEGLLISSKISWERGNRIAAVTKLEQMLNRFPNSDLLLSQLSAYYHEMGDLDKARRVAMLRSLKDPSNHKPRLELLRIYNQENNEEREKSETEQIFEQFSENRTALIDFAGYAAKTGNADLAQRIHTVALEKGFDIDVFTILLIEAYFVNKDYTAALDLSEDLIEQKPEWLIDRWAIFNSLRSLASFAIGRPDLGEVYLQNFLKDTDQKPQTYLNLANYFLTIGRTSQARKILVTAYRQIPKNQRILSALIELELELGNTEKINELLNRLLKMRRPQIKLLEKAYHTLGSDRFIFIQNREILLLQLGAILRENNQDLLSLENTP